MQRDSSCFCRVLVAIGWCLWAAATAPGFAAEVKSTALSVTATDFALDTETGDLAAVDAEQGVTVLYKKAYLDGDENALVGPFKAGNAPVSIAYKKFRDKSYFAVVCNRDAHMYVLTAGEFKAVKKIPVAESDASLAAASTNPQDPYVYYCYGRGHDSTTGRVNLEKLVDEGAMFNDSMDCAVSASGRLFYRRGPWSPSGFECLRLADEAGPDGKPQFDRLFYDHRSTSAYLPDPFDQFTAAGSVVYTADLQKKVADLGFVAMCFLPDRPLVAGLQEKTLVVASYNTFEPLGKLVLPDAFFAKERNVPIGPGSADFKRVGYRTRMLADPKHDRILLAQQNRVLTIPLAALDLPEEPLLMVRREGQGKVEVGKTATIKLAKLDERAEYKLEEEVEGMELVEGGLRWTPVDDQVGTTVVKLRIAHGKTARLQEIELEACRPHVALSFEPSEIQLSPDAKRAVCFSDPTGRSFPPPIDAGARDRTSKIALVDLEKMEVVAEQTMPVPASAAAVDGQFVYVAPSGSSVIHALSLDDLSKQKQAFTNGEVSWLGSVADRWLLASERQGGTSRYALPDLKPDPLPNDAQRESRRRFRQSAGSPAERLNDGWLLGGVVYDATGTKIRLLSELSGFPSVSSTARSTPMIGPHGNRTTGPTPWGRVVEANRLLSQTGQVIATFQDAQSMLRSVHPGAGGGTVLLDDQPAAVSLVVRTQNRSVATHTYSLDVTLQLVVRDLFGGTVQEQITLARESNPGQGRSRNMAAQIRAAGSTVVVLSGSRVYRHAFGELDAAKFPPPFRILPVQSALVVAGDEPTRLTHQVVGGKPPYKTELEGASSAVTIDSQTAEVTVDGPALVKAAEETLLAKLGQAGMLPGSAVGEIELDASNGSNAAVFEKLVGRKPAGTPVVVPIRLRAVDAESQSASLSYQVFLEVPAEPLKEKIAAKRKELEALAAKREAERQARMEAARGGDQAAPPKSVEGLQEEVRELRKRVEALEAKLDLVTRLLTDKRGQEKEEVPPER